MDILKEGFLDYSSLVMLISRKLTKDKRVVTDFSHLNDSKEQFGLTIGQGYIFSVWELKM